MDPTIDGPSTACAFAKNGFVVLRGCLDTDALSSFARAVSDDLSAGRHSEVPLGCIGLHVPGTWPQPGALAAHRIVEVVPAAPTPTERASGGSAHWRGLQQRSGPLGRALNDLLGEGAWEVPCNGDPPSDKRFWYCPVTLPEVPPPPSLAAPRSPAEDATGPAASYHLATLGPIDRLPPDGAELSAALRSPLPCAPADAARLWQPINRRRVVGKGWHVDSFHAHAVVLLVLLSDWAPGCGGTAIIPGTHAWVYRRWLQMQAQEHVDARGDDGATAAPVRMPDDAAAQRDLNSWVTRSMRALTEQGRVRLMHVGPDAAAMLDPPADAPAPSIHDWVASEHVIADGAVSAVQIVGRAGDVVLMHPLLIHSGTMNLGQGARILANGLARLRHPPPPGALGPMDVAALPLP